MHIYVSTFWYVGRPFINTSVNTGWRRPIGCLSLQNFFARKGATNYRALLRKITYKDKASYGSSPPCIYYEWDRKCICVCVYLCILVYIYSQIHIYIYICIYIYTYIWICTMYANHASLQQSASNTHGTENVYVYMHLCVYVYSHIHKNNFMYIYIYIGICMQAIHNCSSEHLLIMGPQMYVCLYT